jgi:hypothetical protein
MCHASEFVAFVSYTPFSPALRVHFAAMGANIGTSRECNSDTDQ